MAFINTVVGRAAASIWGLKLGNATTNAVLTQINFLGANSAAVNAVVNEAHNNSFGTFSNAAIAAAFVNNLGLTGQARTDGIAYTVDQLNAIASEARGAKLLEIASLFSSLTADPLYGSFAREFNAKVAAAVAYSATPGTADAALGDLPSSTSFILGLGQDNITGTAGDDTFLAYIIDNANTLQSGDSINGGAGSDTLFADMGISQAFAVTPHVTDVEKIVIRAQSRAVDSGDNNPSGSGRVHIDAERISGENWYESNNSRADVLIEDVRIAPNQITRDITIAMVETDPGQVDYGVYFDQLSLRSQSTSSATLTLRVLDQFGVQTDPTKPLLDNPYDGVRFTFNGRDIQLRSLDPALQLNTVDTYEEFLVILQQLLAAEPLAAGITASLGGNFTVTASNGVPVTGRDVLLTATGATAVFAPGTWIASGGVPADSSVFTAQSVVGGVSTDLVTSTIVLDDVGRGSHGGHLIVGGLSTGATSTSKGVERFEIEVRDNSQLRSINSTNNTLREVVLVNGETTSNSHAYGKTVKDAGNLTVDNGAPGSYLTGLPGAVAQQANLFGFSDVRLIDGSAMRGMLDFSAEVTAASIAKYLNLKDIQALPAGDNVHFEYSGGKSDDSMAVTLDSAAAASRNTINVGREDFVFTINGGAGDDMITVQVDPALIGGFEHWYSNQKLNKNVTVNGGDGNDTIWTPGAGDFKINGGAGNDTIYADNTGAQTVRDSQASMAGAAYRAAEAAELSAALAVATLQNNTDQAVSAAVLAARTAIVNSLPLTYNDPAVPANPHPILAAGGFKAALQTQILTAVTAGQLTTQQGLALITTYGLSTIVAGQDGLQPEPTTLVLRDINPAELAAVAGTMTAAEYAAGNALLASYVDAARTAVAEAVGSEASWTVQNGLLNATQLAVINANLSVNGSAGGAVGGEASVGVAVDRIGTATVLNALQTLKSQLVVGATAEQVVAAITTAWRAGAFGDPDVVTLAGVAGQLHFDIFSVAGPFPLAAPGLGALTLLLDPAINAANNANITANGILAGAIATNNAAVSTAAGIVGLDPVFAAASAVPGDFVGSNETAAAAAAAQAALTTFNNVTLNPALAVQSGLAALKAAITVGMTELAANILITNALAASTIAGGDAVALLAALNATVPTVGGTINASEKYDADLYITQTLQAPNNNTIAVLQHQQANLQATVAATAFAAAQAAAAAAASPVDPGAPAANDTSNAVWVFNTANQLAVGPGYVLNVNDERALFDLKSDANNSYNFFKAKLTVTFKGLTKTVEVPNTGYKTSDLQVNQAIKDAVNNDPVLSKLIVATDGPANTLVVTSLIDGALAEGQLSVSIAMPTALTAADVAAAAPVYGVAINEAAVLAVLGTAKTAFDTKGDYVARQAETGAQGGNSVVTGRASTTTSDNTINGGAGNDVIVLGTTSGLETLLSSNDTVVFQPGFGNDVIVHFKAGALATGGDILNLSALGGTALSATLNVNKTVNVAEEIGGLNSTADLVAGLYTDSATAKTYVYVAVDVATNVGKVYQVVDAAGVGAGSVTATLAGTIDLADTPWLSLTGDNFGLGG